MKTFWYLASPYSRQPDKEEAWKQARWATARLVKAGLNVFSPILHSHPIAVEGVEGGHEFWVDFVDRPFMEAATGLIVLTVSGWERSEGIAAEVTYFRNANKPILEMAPEDNQYVGNINPDLAAPATVRQRSNVPVWNTMYSGAQPVVVRAEGTTDDDETDNGVTVVPDANGTMWSQ